MEKKKIKNLTIRECIDICYKQLYVDKDKGCADCPIKELCGYYGVYQWVGSYLLDKPSYLDDEVETVEVNEQWKKL